MYVDYSVSQVYVQFENGSIIKPVMQFRFSLQLQFIFGVQVHFRFRVHVQIQIQVELQLKWAIQKPWTFQAPAVRMYGGGSGDGGRGSRGDTPMSEVCVLSWLQDHHYMTPATMMIKRLPSIYLFSPSMQLQTNFYRVVNLLQNTLSHNTNDVKISRRSAHINKNNWLCLIYGYSLLTSIV